MVGGWGCGRCQGGAASGTQPPSSHHGSAAVTPRPPSLLAPPLAPCPPLPSALASSFLPRLLRLRACPERAATPFHTHPHTRSKGSWEGVTPAEASALKRDASVRIVTQDERFLAHLAEVRRGLAARGVSGDAAAYVEDLLVQVGGRVGMVYAVCLFVCILVFCSGKGGASVSSRARGSVPGACREGGRQHRPPPPGQQPLPRGCWAARGSGAVGGDGGCQAGARRSHSQLALLVTTAGARRLRPSPPPPHPLTIHTFVHAAQEHQQLHEALVAEENKRRALLDIVYGLEVGGGAGGRGAGPAVLGDGGGAKTVAWGMACQLGTTKALLGCEFSPKCRQGSASLSSGCLEAPLPLAPCHRRRRTRNGSWRRPWWWRGGMRQPGSTDCHVSGPPTAPSAGLGRLPRGPLARPSCSVPPRLPP
jgi:hypothetical protein